MDTKKLQEKIEMWRREAEVQRSYKRHGEALVLEACADEIEDLLDEVERGNS